MGNFSRDKRSGGRRDFNRRDFGRQGFDDRRSDRQMHNAVCSNCGKDCEVPFMPTGDKPVFCSECFEKRNRDSGPRRFEDRGPSRSNFQNNRPQNNAQFEEINTKLDKILKILTPTPSKPEDLVVEIPQPQSKELTVDAVKTSKKTPKKKKRVGKK